MKKTPEFEYPGFFNEHGSKKKKKISNLNI